MTLLLRRCEIDGHLGDVRIADRRIVDVAPTLPRRHGEEIVDAGGGAVLPGLVDHHMHLHALAASLTSVRCGPPQVRDRAGLAAALAAAAPDRGWIRGVGYAESVAGDIDATAIDAMHPQRPVRIQHRSGALWIVNTVGAATLGLDRADHPGVERAPGGRPTGRLWRADDWLRTRIPGSSLPRLDDVGHQLCALGITHVTDATPDLDGHALDALCGAIPQRIHVLGVPIGLTAPAPLTIGPYKIVIADSDLPDLDTLVDTVRSAHDLGRGVAAHCVTREALVLYLVALDVAGPHPSDRIEHGALIPAEIVPDLARRRVRVVTQPGFLADRGQSYLSDLPHDDHQDLYRCATLTRAGVPLALSSDAPYGPLDPWAVIAAAVDRRADGDGRVVGPADRLSPREALNAYLGAPDDPGGRVRRVEEGAPADLVVLDRPLAAQLARPDARAVQSVIIDGAVVR